MKNSILNLLLSEMLNFHEYADDKFKGFLVSHVRANKTAYKICGKLAQWANQEKKVSTRPECVIRIYRILSTVDIQVGLVRFFFSGLRMKFT